MSLEHVLITGAAGAIGSALATTLARRNPDARLTLLDRAQGPLDAVAAPLGERARTLVADLADTTTLPAVLSGAEAGFGPVFGLVNCAGIMDVRALEAVPWADAERLLTIDLLAPLRLQSLVLPHMVAARRGFIVNIASMAGRVPLKGCVYYGAAKAGLAMASEVARVDLARHGITVVTVYPGPVRSDLERRARAQWSDGALRRHMPTGDPAALAERVADAIASRSPRVIYPAAYGVGFLLDRVAARFALAFGPAPTSQRP